MSTELAYHSQTLLVMLSQIGIKPFTGFTVWNWTRTATHPSDSCHPVGVQQPEAVLVTMMEPDSILDPHRPRIINFHSCVDQNGLDVSPCQATSIAGGEVEGVGRGWGREGESVEEGQGGRERAGICV